MEADLLFAPSIYGPLAALLFATSFTNTHTAGILLSTVENYTHRNLQDSSSLSW